MALVADSPADRAEQLLLLTQRLGKLIDDETARINARAPTATPDLVAEKERLANAYRLELARIKDGPALISGAPQPLIDRLKAETARLQTALVAHEHALGAVKYVAEGLVQAIAEEISRQRTVAGPYAATGAHAGAAGPAPVALDKTA